MCVLAPGLSLSIIIDSRVKLIDNERLGASPCDPRGRLHANNTLIVLYNIRLHIPCSYFAFSLGFFHFLFHAEAANRKQIVNIATRGTTACGQKWFRFRHLPYIFHIKPFIFIAFSWSHSLSDFHEMFSIKCRNKYSFFFV